MSRIRHNRTWVWNVATNKLYHHENEASDSHKGQLILHSVLFFLLSQKYLILLHNTFNIATVIFTLFHRYFVV